MLDQFLDLYRVAMTPPGVFVTVGVQLVLLAAVFGALRLATRRRAALDAGRHPQIFGDDYPTPDGTCIRDYIHVMDLAEAHVAAASRCEGGNAADVFNVGRGVGSSVSEVMDVISSVTGADLDAEVAPRRPGDPPATCAATDSIRDEMGWNASRDLEDMVSSAWRAHTLEQ